jgi:predicted phage tail protein
MRKKIGIVSLIFLLLGMVETPFSAFALSGGSLNGKTMYLSNSLSGGTPEYRATDNNNSTQATLTDKGSTTNLLYYVFPSPVDIDSAAVGGTENTSHDLIVRFYDSNKVLIQSLDPTVNSSGIPGYDIVAPTARNVKYVVLENTNISASPFVREFDVGTTTVPTGLTATAGSKQAQLSWIAASGATGYNVYKDGVKVTSSPTTSTSYTSTGLTDLTTYSYQVTSISALGSESAKSAVVKVTTPNTTPPVAPTGLTGTQGNGSASLSWVSNGESDLRGYFIYQNGTKLNSSPVTSTNYMVESGLTNGTAYSYQVTAVNASGLESAKSAVVTVTPNTPPKGAEIAIVRGGNTVVPELIIVNYNEAKSVNSSDLLPYSYSTAPKMVK